MWDEEGMHLCTVAQLQARVTSEPIPKRLQKGPKTEGGKGSGRGPEWAAAGYAVLQKKGNGVDSCECLLSRRSVFASPPGYFTMGDWQQMTEGRTPFGKRLTTLLELAPSCTSLTLFVRRIADKVLVIRNIDWINF